MSKTIVPREFGFNEDKSGRLRMFDSEMDCAVLTLTKDGHTPKDLCRIFGMYDSGRPMVKFMRRFVTQAKQRQHDFSMRLLSAIFASAVGKKAK